jgi:protein-S-isoprenylcysteine O-methyltransferase Ste14
MPKLLPPAYFFAAIVLAALAGFLFPVPVLIPSSMRLVGILPIIVGIALNLAADRQFKRHGTTVKPFQRSSALITDGVFRWSRNPMYLGMVLIVAGVAALEGTVISWMAVVALALILDRAFIRHEESMLEETFGTEFREYRERTRRWL